MRETLDCAPADVWAYLVEFDMAPEWMAGIADFTQITPGPLEIGARFSFVARSKVRETRVTALDPGKRITLTSMQGGVTATYVYSVIPAGDGAEITLETECKATGFW